MLRMMALVVAGCVVFGPGAAAEVIKFKAQLSGASEVPPNNSTASGQGEGTLDTSTMVSTWTVTYQGLSGPAIGAHLHGPGEPGKNAGIVVPFNFVASSIKHTAKLTDAQIADLLAGRWYVNIHTIQHPGGELRGQVVRE